MTKKIQVEMTLKPTDKGYKKELIQKTMHLPVEALIAYAKENGIELTKKHIYNARWVLRKNKKPKRKIAKVRSKRTSPGTAIVKASSAAIVKAKRTTRRRAAPAQDSNGSNMVSEKAMAKLILQLGTLKARELINRTEATFNKNLGI